MDKCIINSYEELQQYVGKVLGVSDYFRITQEHIDQFANVTMDRQWIHTDTDRASKESPYHSTIAHGYLTLSLLPHLWNQIVEVNHIRMMINYGIENMRFGHPVLSGQSIRMTATLLSVKNLRGAIKTEIKFLLDILESGKKALEGRAYFIYYFA